MVPVPDSVPEALAEAEEVLEATDELWASRRAWSSRERKFIWRGGSD